MIKFKLFTSNSWNGQILEQICLFNMSHILILTLYKYYSTKIGPKYPPYNKH